MYVFCLFLSLMELELIPFPFGLLLAGPTEALSEGLQLSLILTEF